jgi:NAD(P)-dependent dehydrogenase (short-subunit alcohol dehydrogenase family)
MTILDRFRLDDRRALVTGGGRGLGRVIAQALAEAGADVSLAGRSLDTVRAAAREIAQTTGRKTLALGAHVAVAAEVERLVREVEAGLGPVDILVNNAGVNIRGPVGELGEADWDAVVDTNMKAPFLCARALGAGMCARGWGRVINLGSILSTVSLAGRAPYCASKAGVLGLTRVLALEWAKHGVTVNAICPGPFGTDMNLPLRDDPAKYQAFVEKIPLGRWGELHEIAGAAVFLASDAASFVTGSALYVDGAVTPAGVRGAAQAPGSVARPWSFSPASRCGSSSPQAISGVPARPAARSPRSPSSPRSPPPPSTSAAPRPR